MYNTSILDSYRLLNTKSRYGLRQTNAGAVSNYQSDKRLRKFLTEKLTPYFKYPNIDLVNFIDAIADRCKNSEFEERVKEYFFSTTPEQFIEDGLKIKSFMKKLKNLSL